MALSSQVSVQRIADESGAAERSWPQAGGAAPLLLTDEQMRTFITEGFLILQTDFSAAFHESLLAQLNEVYEQEGNPGNNLLPRIPELREVFSHPAVTGALTSVLGPDYLLHTHRHGHFNASPKPGNWHKDSYWGYKRMRNHHPWWAMIMYFPQDTPVELGPTGLYAGTQYHEHQLFEIESADEALASGPAGTFALIHYDVWHRATANRMGKERYMLKFEFMRTRLPEQPSWNNAAQKWQPPVHTRKLAANHPELYEEMWSWLSGRLCAHVAEQLLEQESKSAADGIKQGATATQQGTATQQASRAQALLLQQLLNPADEAEALNAAYGLARCGQAGVQGLLQVLTSGQAISAHAAAYGLSVSGAAAVPGLVQALGHADVQVVQRAVFALGELRELAAAAVQPVLGLLAHANADVRSAAIETLGQIGMSLPDGEGGEQKAAIVQGLAAGLQDANVQVGFTAGLALIRMGPAGAAALPQLVEALKDDNRYVRGHAVEALRYIDTPAAKEALLDYLLWTRWCPTTTSRSTFYP